MNMPFEPSPNYWAGNASRIKAIVYHHTAGAFEAARNWLKNPASYASAHVIVRKDGYILQIVREKDSAWHCGIKFATTPKDRVAQIIRDNWGTNPNLFTLGVEIEGAGEPFTDAQYNTLIELTKFWTQSFNIPVDRYHLIGHYEVNPTGKPTDPREMDWDRLINGVKNLPMDSFNYSLYIKDNNLYMKVLKGSINEAITVKNEGTSWTGHPFCNKSVGNDGNAINIDMTANLYTIIAKGVTKQFDNRPVVDPTAVLKAQLEAANKTIAERDAEIASLKNQLGSFKIVTTPLYAKA